MALFAVLWALRGLLLGSAWGHLRCLLVRWMRFGVRVLRDVVDFSYHGGQVEASRSGSASSGSHFGAQKPPKTIENAQSNMGSTIEFVVICLFGHTFLSHETVKVHRPTCLFF